MALVGTIEMFPPPLVRAFWAMVSGCKSTTRVGSLRYSSGVGGRVLYFPRRGRGSLKAQCFTSPCPPCITAHVAESQLARYSEVLALGKWRFLSGIRSFFWMRSKHIVRSAFSKLSGCDAGTSLPVSTSNHSSIPQKCPLRMSSPSSFTSRATSGSCSVGPMGPQMPTGLSAVLERQAVMYSRASAR